jgi:hypothetical protein
MTEEEQQAFALLADLQRLVGASSDDVKRELAAANQAVARSRGDAPRVKLAFLLSLSSTGVADEGRALSLLEQVIGKAPSSTPTRQLAAVLYAGIVERQRELREEQKKTDALQQKLDALKSVERNLLERDRRPPPVPKAPPPPAK